MATREFSLKSLSAEFVKGILTAKQWRSGTRMNTCHENPLDHFSLWVVRNSVKKAYLVHRDRQPYSQEQISTVKVFFF